MTVSSVDGNPTAEVPAQRPAGKITLNTLKTMRQEQQPIAMLTCYDFPTAKILATCGVPVLLVGDSAATTVLGESSTIHATMDFMILLTRAVRRGAPEVFLMGDMPFGSYATAESAVSNGKRFLVEAGVDCVKLECDLRHESIVRAMAMAGIPVCAHLGLLPQRAVQQGGYRYQGRTEPEADRLVGEGVAMVQAGAELLLLEAVPDRVSRRIVEAAGCPVLGCGAGPSCHGHVLVLHDMLGYTEKVPRFVECFGTVPAAVAGAASAAILPLTPKFGHASGITVPSGFDKYTENYATFCNTPADKRVFYTLLNNRIVKENSNSGTWRADTIRQMQHVPRLPIPGGSWYGVPMTSPIPGLSGDGPYKPTWESLLQYDCPEWFRDAKFGIWNHWSPQCVPEDGDWYARLMYVQGSQQYKYNLNHYGHPSVFGYKDLCPQWTLLNWEPEELMASYKRAGAKLFLALANHHDGFDTWNSRHHPWNAQNIGPHRDVIGTWAKTARRHGLRFGVTVHQAYNWWWFQTSHGADHLGPLAGVPYDGDLTKAQGKGQWWEGLDPQQLYGPKHLPDALPDISYVKNFYDRTRDLVDQHHPDLLYFDNPRLPLGWGGMNIGAYFYNRNLQLNGGKMEGVINVKGVNAHLAKSVVADIERGVTSRIMPHPWQSETCLGDWHYQRALFNDPGTYGGYLKPNDVIHWMIDVVSKNGTFILNIPGKPDGTIDRKEQLILENIGDWFKINGEAIYFTRPWKIYGEGPNVMRAGSMHGKSISQLSEKDIRFTRNKANTVIYGLVLGWPKEAFMIHAMGTAAATNPGKIQHVELLGTDEKLHWTQTAAGLRVTLPKYRPTVDYAVALKVIL